jgi:hypothetical protein
LSNRLEEKDKEQPIAPKSHHQSYIERFLWGAFSHAFTVGSQTERQLSLERLSNSSFLRFVKGAVSQNF